MKPKIRAYSNDYKEWVSTNKFSIIWGYYKIMGDFKIWLPNKNISMSADEQYTQNKLSNPKFTVSERVYNFSNYLVT